MNPWLFRLVAAALVGLALLGLAAALLVDSPRQLTTHAQMIGQPAPPLQLAGWVGRELQPQDLAGKITVVDFWATWCVPCIAAIPHNNELYRRYQPKGVEFVAIATLSEPQHVAQVARRMIYPVALDDEQASTARLWHVQYYPTYAVVDRQGILRAIGIVPDAVPEVLDQLLAEQPAPPAPVQAQ